MSVMRPCLLFLLSSVLDLSFACAQDLRVEIRNQRGAAMAGYLLLRPEPPGLEAMAGLTTEQAAQRHYDYYREPLAPGNYAVRGEQVLTVTGGAIEIPLAELNRPADSIIYAFFYWTNATPSQAPDTGTAEERLERTDLVTWWTIRPEGDETQPGGRLLQRVTILDRNHWTENRGDFRESPFGRPVGPLEGYVPGKTERASIILEPPLGMEERTLPPVLLVPGTYSTAASWRMGDSSFQQYLRGKGFPVWELQWAFGQSSIVDGGDMIRLALSQVLGAANAARVDVVTHGYGGVALRRALQAYPDLAGQLGRLLMMAPPHHGSYTAARFRSYQGLLWPEFTRRMAQFGPGFHDPLAGANNNISPGSSQMLDVERGAEAFREFKEWKDLDGDGRADRAAVVLAGSKPFALPGEDTQNREAPEHSDGLVSMSSASLLDQGVPFASIHLNHHELASSESAAAAVAAFLEDPATLASVEGVVAGDLSTTGNCGATGRAGLVVDLRGFSACGVAGVETVRWVNGALSENLTPQIAGTYYYWSRQPDARISATPGVYPGLAAALGPDKRAPLAGAVHVTCRTGPALYQQRVSLQACRTATVVGDDANTSAVLPLTLSKLGEGAVTSNPAGLVCGTGCTSVTEFIPPGRILLTAAPAERFLGWSGACLGAAPSCAVNMDAARSVHARFLDSAPQISTLTLNPNVIASGRTAVGKVTLAEPAPPGGMVVALSSAGPAATVPATVTVEYGRTWASFTINARTVISTQNVEITAQAAGRSKSEGIWVVPAPLGPITPSAFSMDFIAVQPGQLTIPESSGAYTLRVTSPYEIGKYEVTQAQWEAVMGFNPSRFEAANQPVEQVLWDDVHEFLARLNARADGYRYRLPNRTEWEYAARAGTTSASPGGTVAEVAWIYPEARSPKPVGTKRPNPWGLHDMLGNVAELVADWDNGVDWGSLRHPVELYPAQRGCSYWCVTSTLSLSSDGSASLSGVSSYVGFRCLRERAPASAEAPRPVEFSIFDASIQSGGRSVARVILDGPAPTGGAVVTLSSGSAMLTTATVPAGLNGISFRFLAPAITATQEVILTASAGGGTRTATVKVTARAAAGAPVPGPFDMAFIPLPPGEFTMGCSPNDWTCDVIGKDFRSEIPAHPVRLTRGFEISQYEVTQEQWQAVMGTNPSRYKGPAFPVGGVYWNHAQEFARRLTLRNDGYRYRLPSEAEWEYAARAGTADQFAGGPIGPLVFPRPTRPVGQAAPNPWGLYDMLSGVSEWVEDWPSQYTAALAVDPVGAASGTNKLVRGFYPASPAALYGVFYMDLLQAENPWRITGVSRRTTIPAPVSLAAQLYDVGFRCVRERIDSGTPPTLTAFSLSAATLFSRNRAVATINVGPWAAHGGTTITLQSADPRAVEVPASVTIPPGLTEATFQVVAGEVAETRQVVVTARLGSGARTVTLTVSPPPQAGPVAEGPFNMRFVPVPPGEFVMGCSLGDELCTAGESPQHPVRITKNLEAGVHEVTQSQWEAVMGANPSASKGGGKPVEQVTWFDVQDFMARLNARTDGYRYRLPTEAEWEYLARAGTDDATAGGSAGESAWHAYNSGGQTHPVGEKKPNNWGLFDTLGNVSEWVQDGEFVYSADPQTDPLFLIVALSERRRLRGASFANGPSEMRVSVRFGNEGRSPNRFIGFRCVRERIP
jgi:formylglycine-generating enzyme required for sulfatase activity